MSEHKDNANYSKCSTCNLLLSNQHVCVNIVFSPFDQSYEQHICSNPERLKLTTLNTKRIKEVCNK